MSLFDHYIGSEKVRASPTPFNSMKDSRIRATESRDGVLHPSEGRNPGNPRPVTDHVEALCLNLPSYENRLQSDLTTVLGTGPFVSKGVV